MKVRYLQHAHFEGLGSMEPWLEAHGHEVSGTKMFEGETLPAVNDFELLIVMGGPMSVGDVEQYPWLDAEREFIRHTVESGCRVLGVCLGSQLVASALGAPVTRNEHSEIGWFPLQLTHEAADSPIGRALVDGLDVLHWHGDTFAIPAGARHIASSDACAHQAFVLGDRVVGFQFHLEATPASTRKMIEHCGDDLAPARFVQSAEELIARPARFDRVNSVMERVLSVLLSEASTD